MLSFTLSGKTYTWTTNNIDRRKLNRILDLFNIISCIIVFASFLYFYVDFLSCSYTVHVSYTFIFEIFLKSHFQVSLYTRCLENRKIFRLTRNLTKFDKVARFCETNLTAHSVSSFEI